uniref:RNA helicase n=1 Tax=Glossina austeni TaxID=7395 RepID=A0A1A9UNS1_GLOAU
MLLKLAKGAFKGNNLRNYGVRAAIKTKAVRQEAQQLLIECKRSEFNLYNNSPGDAHVKFGILPLASSGWLHNKSKDDWFHIKATIDEKSGHHKMQNVEEFFKNSGVVVHKSLIDNLQTELEINQLTEIQCQAWHKLYNSNHVLIAAETGCGKTLTYLLPILQKIVERKQCEAGERKLNSPLALIISPGRELTEQISSVAHRLCKTLNINVKTLLGGNTKQLLLNPEFGEVDVLVASVGALSKLVTTGIYRTKHVRHVVLDEADTLLDDSFSNKLAHLLKKFPFHRNHTKDDLVVGTQLVFASATMPTNIHEQLHQVIDIETIHKVVSANLHKLMDHVEQRFLRVNKSDRLGHLLAIVKKELAHRRPVIIFSNKTPTCDYVDIFLNNSGVKSLNLNGDMLRKIRAGRFEQFQNGACDVLSTTDVGSRGLDTTRARHVINYDFPLHISDYIHRCGRIGRVGCWEKCLVTNLVSSRREIDIVQRIERAARTGGLLSDVNANIKNIINKKIMEDMKQAGVALQVDEAF